MPKVVGLRWEKPPTMAFAELVDAYTHTIMLSGRRVAESRAQDAEQWMKQNAPWQDRTGDARAGLHVEVHESPGVLAELEFAHGADVPYAVWLELAHGGQYAIIAPAIDYWGPKLMIDIQRIVNLGLASR